MAESGTPLSRTTVPKAVRENTANKTRQRRERQFPGIWVYVGDPLATGMTTTPDFLNGWTYLGTSYVGFRHGMDGETEYVGTLDASGASSGTVAFILPPPYRPFNKTYSFVTDLDQGGGLFNVARVAVALNGQRHRLLPLHMSGA